MFIDILLNVIIKTQVSSSFIFHFILYLMIGIGGIRMNDFEKDPQEKGNDVVYAARGFIASFVFFSLIFVIGVVINVIN